MKWIVYVHLKMECALPSVVKTLKKHPALVGWLIDPLPFRIIFNLKSKSEEPGKIDARQQARQAGPIRVLLSVRVRDHSSALHSTAAAPDLLGMFLR